MTSPETDSLTQSDQPNELFINAQLQNDAQNKYDDVVIPNNVKYLSEVFSMSHAAQLPPHRTGIKKIIEISDGKLPRVVLMSRLSEKEKEENRPTY
ncbi:hypothetical protein K3495_g6664 [Podosphaera aphanis]|nr:hypothetical protein K3495_g6664 [Podosphaera aphanis]